MRSMLPAIFVALLAGCAPDGPRKGDVYQDIRSRDQVVVLATGTAPEIVAAYRQFKSALDAYAVKYGGTPYDMVDPTVLVDSLSEAVAFGEHELSHWKVVSREGFEDSFVFVERPFVQIE